MNEEQKINKITIFALQMVLGIIILFLVLPLTINEYNIKINADLRNTTNETYYEFKVLNVEKIDPFFSSPYYSITYIGKNNIISNIEFKENSNLEIIISNESKLILINPEENGWPERNILYWSFKYENKIN